MATSDGSQVTWYTQLLPKATAKALNFLSKQDWLKRSEWYLAGGTALALQMGHRMSVDLDFFIPQSDFHIPSLVEHFPKEVWHSDIVREGTLYGKLLGAKVSFIAYPFFRSKYPAQWYGAVRVLSSKDIAVMKVIAISQRGKKRDFVDLYWYAKNQEPLFDVLLRLDDQYPNTEHNYHHILKSLTYFNDAEDDPMPTLHFKATWKEVKSYFQKEVPRLAKELLGIR